MEEQGRARLSLFTFMASRIPSYAIIGHRGAPRLVPPGNTLESLARAIEVGAQMLEVDVRATRDNALVLDHESSRRINGCHIAISERTYNEWQAHAAEPGLPLTRLDDVFTLVRSTDIALMLDFKQPGIEALLVDAMRSSGIPYDRILVPGANAASRQILRSLDPDIPLSLSLDAGAKPSLTARILAEIDTEAVTWHHALITRPIVAALRERGIVVYTWTVDKKADMLRLRDECGVDGIITNTPELLASL